MNIDKIARSINEEIMTSCRSDIDADFWDGTKAIEIIKQALQEYGDECAKQMRENAFNVTEGPFTNDLILSLPLPSELPSEEKK